MLGKKSIEHIVIRRPEFVAGTKKKPEVKVFVQSHKKHMPIKLSKLKPNQVIWMKWVGGPIVAKAKILSWHSGHIINGNINEVRKLTIGTNLFGLDYYWHQLMKKGTFFYVVVRMSDEKWLEELIYPKVKSYGANWVYIDSEKKKRDWLSNKVPPPMKSSKSRSIPIGLRFELLRRDNFTCVYCGRSAPEVVLQIDHVIPWSQVKEHNIDNLVTSCRDCNLGKRDKVFSRAKS